MKTRPRPTIQLKATRHIEPPPKVASSEWLQANVTMPQGSETGGMPFSLASFPHCDGVLEAFDNPSIRTITLQWGTRLGKTTTCLSLMARVAGTCPRNMMFASSTKESASRVVSERLYPILASTDTVRQQLLPEHRRSQLKVKLHACKINVGWSGSDTSLADVGAWYGVANEIDKWSQELGSEADSLDLFINRFKGFTNHKIIFESTPTITNKSRIESLLLASNRHKRYVPCPHCGEFQILRKGDPKSPGGFRWETDDKGNSDPDTAAATAYYECEKCGEHIENFHRILMLRRGIWCPDGCSVDREGKIQGTAIRANSVNVGFGPLPSWYALTETWGSFAAKWIAAQKKPRKLQDVVNSYMAETWAVKRTKSNPETVGERIRGETIQGVVPAGAAFLTVTVDRQQADGGFCPWVVMAHADDGRAWVVNCGASRNLDHIWTTVIRGKYPKTDGNGEMSPVICGVDSGWDTKNTYDFCNAHQGMAIPLKGANTDLGAGGYRLVNLVESSNRSKGQTRKVDGQDLLHVGTDFWETDLESRLYEKLANEPGSLTLCREASVDEGFLSQLCNGVLKDVVDSRGSAKLLWIKRNEEQPNDYRDCVRYGLCLAEYWRDKVKAIKPMVTRSFAEMQKERRAQT